MIVRRSYNVSMWRYFFLLLLATAVAAQDGDHARLDFATKSLPTATTGRSYNVTIKLENGRGPFEWAITKGKLPPGINMLGNTGVLGGVPTQSGVYTFTLTVRDLTTRATAQREFVIEVHGALLLEWVNQPKLTENTISGSIKVTNNSTRGENFDLTVIIVAVNEVGKAFALGYEHFSLAQDVEQTIPFSSTVPNGRYIVHVDAVAEVPERQAIYRSRLQTASPLVVNVNR